MQTRSSSDDDLYDILGISASADNETIRKAFRKLALQHHPDKLPVGSSHELFVKLQAAYSILRDGNARKKYDCDLQNQRKRRRARTKTTKTKRKKEPVFFTYVVNNIYRISYITCIIFHI